MRLLKTCLASFVLATAPAMQAAAEAQLTQGQAALYEQAKEEGEVNWYVSHYDQAFAEGLVRGFEEMFPDVSVQLLRTSASVGFQRLNQDIMAGVANCDVYSSTDISHYIHLKDEGLLEQFTPENEQFLVETLRGTDPDGYYHTTYAGLALITYNTREVSEDEAPRNWTDLVDSKWRGKVATGHPGFSGTVAVWAAAMQDLYGDEFFVQLEENDPLVGRSITDTVTMLSSAERVVAVGPSDTTLTVAAQGNPLGVIYPEDGALLMTSASGILADAPNPAAAKLFMEYLMSETASQIMVEYFSPPLRPDVPTGEGVESLADIALITPDTERLVEQLPAVRDLWRDIFEN